MSRPRLARLAIAGAAVAGAVALAPSTALAAPAKTRVLLAAPAATVDAGAALTVTGTLTPRARRSVQLQVAQGPRRWRTLATTTSTRRTGQFTLRTTALRTPGTAVLRVRAPRTSRARTGLSTRFSVTVQTPGATAPGGTTPGATTSPGAITPAGTPTPTPTPAARPAFRVLSVTASDQPADPAKPAAIRNTLAAVDGWYATQTIGGVRPRWVRDGAGAVVVQAVQLPSPRATYTSMDFAPLAAAIEAASPPPAGQKTLAFFDVNATGACGVTGGGMSLITEATCDIRPSATSGWPYGASYLVAHELAHNFGAVRSCAPHSQGGGHVGDDPRDLLYNGPAAREWAAITLDPGRDDYYATGNAACPGIESSPYWTATSDPLS